LEEQVGAFESMEMQQGLSDACNEAEGGGRWWDLNNWINYPERHEKKKANQLGQKG